LSNPTFSIILPTFNRAEYIGTAIESVLIQRHQDWELIIVDDGSTDDTRDIVDSFVDERISLISSSHNGVSSARNKGILAARGSYICFLDSDDVYFPDHLYQFDSFISKHPSTHIILRTGMIHLYHGREIKTGIYHHEKHGDPIHFILTHFSGIISYCIPKQFFEKFSFHEDLMYFEDTYLLVSLMLQHPFHQIPVYTCRAHAHALQVSSLAASQSNYQEHIENNILAIEQLFRNHELALKNRVPGSLKNKLLARKHLQYANALLLENRFRPSITTFRRSLLSTSLDILWHQLKFLIKLPVKLIFNYPKRAY